MTHSDCIAYLRTLPDASVDSCVTDPPYELGFMGKKWDSSGIAYSVELWREVLRALKPGAHLLAFGGTRTHHRMVCAIEDAGFEIRDEMQWLYGSGFPKSLDVSKAIDKAAGELQTQSVGFNVAGKSSGLGTIQRQELRSDNPNYSPYAPATAAAKQWDGWGTALKPAVETICLAQKPLDLSALCGILARKIGDSICQLQSHAKDAGKSSTSSPSGQSEDADSVLWRAVPPLNTPDDLFAAMATSLSGLDAPSSLNIALSWLNTLGALSSHASTFTTETASSLTTDLRILNSLPSTTMREGITVAGMRQRGIGSSVSTAEAIFSAVRMKLDFILTPSAGGFATSTDGQSGLRPDARPICVARKPLEGTVAANVLKHGTGGINVDGCRVAGIDPANAKRLGKDYTTTETNFGGGQVQQIKAAIVGGNLKGRWPANVILSHAEGCVCTGTKRVKGSNCKPDDIGSGSAKSMFQSTGKITASHVDADGLETVETWQCVEGCPVRLLDSQSGESTSPLRVSSGASGKHGIYGAKAPHPERDCFGDTGGASRFFYTAKSSKSDREHFNTHATVKPLALMRYLVRLVTPPGGVVLDMFAGSGTTLVAARQEGFRFLGCDADEGHVRIAQDRLALELPFET